MDLQRGLLSLFTTQQYAEEIVSVLTNKEIDNYLNVGCRILIDAKQILDSGEYINHGIPRDRVERDIKCIEYNLEQFTQAFLKKENMEVLTKYDEPMYFHMN